MLLKNSQDNLLWMHPIMYSLVWWTVFIIWASICSWLLWLLLIDQSPSYFNVTMFGLINTAITATLAPTWTGLEDMVFFKKFKILERCLWRSGGFSGKECLGVRSIKGADRRKATQRRGRQREDEWKEGWRGMNKNRTLKVRNGSLVVVMATTYANDLSFA